MRWQLLRKRLMWCTNRNVWCGSAGGYCGGCHLATDHPQMGEIIKRENLIKLGEVRCYPGTQYEPKTVCSKKQKRKNSGKLMRNHVVLERMRMQCSSVGRGRLVWWYSATHMHSPCELVHLKDLDNCAKLIAKTVEKIGPRTSFIPF